MHGCDPEGFLGCVTEPDKGFLLHTSVRYDPRVVIPHDKRISAHPYPGRIMGAMPSIALMCHSELRRLRVAKRCEGGPASGGRVYECEGRPGHTEALIRRVKTVSVVVISG
jgi:hypothetical protein